MRKKLIAEFIGTYLLYLIIGMCITQPGVSALTPIAVGVGLAALVYTCDHISKAHFNQATTITYFCAGTHALKDVGPYAITIVAGAHAVGPISFAAFNPAVSLALCINGVVPWAALSIYILVQVAAAAIAGRLFRNMGITNPDEFAK